MKLFIWENTNYCGGGKFGGMIVGLGATPDEARLNVWKRAMEDTKDEDQADYWDRVVCSDGSSRRMWLTNDLAKEPRETVAAFAQGGDW